MLSGWPELTRAQFRAIREIVHQAAGIHLHAGKEGLVRSRLGRRLHTLGLSDFDAYLDWLRRDAGGRELSAMVDALTTNKTSFFREPRHFDYLRDAVLPDLFVRGRRIRVWSAGCSSGEEPYTLAIVIREAAGAAGTAARILATDLCTDVLKRARAAEYDRSQLGDVPAPLLRRHFDAVAGAPGRVRVKIETRGTVRFARLNLIADWPMKGPFDVIFCRNVMIYFDERTQARLVGRLRELLVPGGHLFIGHAESLSGIPHTLRYVQPAVYVR